MNSVFDTTGVQPLILEILARHNRFQPKQLEEIGELLGKANPGAILEAVLIKGGYLSDQEVAKLYAEDLFLPLAARRDASSEIDKELASFLPEKLCTDKLICPMAVRDDVLDVAFVSPETMGVVDELQLLTGLRINPLIGPLSLVEFQLDALYRAHRESKAIGEESDGFQDTGDDQSEPDENILNIDTPPPNDENGRIVRMVNQILEQAMRNGASDIHLEPFEDCCKFRLRIDGELHELPSPSKAVFIMILSRLKVLAKMDIAEKRIPQDGAIALRAGDKRVDLRVNTVPTVHGEKMVMRILDKDAIPLNLTGLGLDERQSADLHRIDSHPLRAGPGDRADRQRQVHDSVCLPQPAQRAPAQYLHCRRPGRVQVQGDEPGSGQGPGWAHVFLGLAGLSPAGPRHHHGGRGPRPGDRRDLPTRGAHRSLCPLDDPYQ